MISELTLIDNIARVKAFQSTYISEFDRFTDICVNSILLAVSVFN